MNSVFQGALSIMQPNMEYQIVILCCFLPVLGPDGVYEPDYSQYDTELSLFNTTSQMQYNQALTGEYILS